MDDPRARQGEDPGTGQPDSTPASSPNPTPRTIPVAETPGPETTSGDGRPAEPETGASGVPEPVRAIESVVGAAAEGIAAAIADGLSAVAGRISRRLSHEPLTNLYELHPEARVTSPRELGFRFVPVEDIAGTAVAGAAQRGQDFLPLPPFRGENWQARWQRIREANRLLRPLPPVDLIKYAGSYWVVDGHNRVGAALADRAVGLDAMVTELVPLDGHVSERPTNLLLHLGELAELRTAAAGHRPAMGVQRPIGSTLPPPKVKPAPRRRDSTGEQRERP